MSHRKGGVPIRAAPRRSRRPSPVAVSFVDEPAAEADRDPVEYRPAQLGDPRARAVVEAAPSAGWAQWSTSDSLGNGIGFARYKNSGAYCAVVTEVEANEEVQVRRLVIAVDAGLVISLDGALG